MPVLDRLVSSSGTQGNALDAFFTLAWGVGGASSRTAIEI